MEVIIILHLGLAYWLYRYFKKGDRGAKEPRTSLRITIIFGVIAIFLAGILNNLFLPDSLIKYLSGAGPMPPALTLLYGSLMVGVIEESLKFIPLAFWIYNKKYFNETTDGIIYFGLCGMWFGAIESIGYALIDGEGIGIMRLIIGPFLHAGFTALAGWGLIRFKLHKQRSALFTLFVLAILVHGLYDFFLFTGSPILVSIALLIAVCVNLSVFRLFKQARKSDESVGLSTVGINRFCRECGTKNHDRTLFCTACGKKT